MTREPRPLQPRAVAAWVGGTLAGLALLAALAEPVLFLWYLALGFLLATSAVWVVAFGLKEERDRALAELHRRDEEDAAFLRAAHDAVHDTRPRLWAVPQQRRGDDVYDQEAEK